MSARWTFTVFGVPIPKGSTKAFMRRGMKFPVVTNDNPKTKGWQQMVLEAARSVLAAAPPIEGPVALAVAFYVPRPKSAPKRVTEPTTRPDLDKLLRCIKDGLTRAGVYRDDSQVVFIASRKAFAASDYDPDGAAGVPRAVIEVYQGSSITVERYDPAALGVLRA